MEILTPLGQEDIANTFLTTNKNFYIDTFLCFVYQWFFLQRVIAHPLHSRSNSSFASPSGKTAYYSTEDGARTAGFPAPKIFIKLFRITL
jgi:hypothetical protein